MSTGMRKWMEKDCPEIQCLPAQVSIDREELKQLRDELDKYKAERDALRAKVEAMERQDPVAWLHESRRDSDVVTSAVKHVWGKAVTGSLAAYSIPLYLAPGAKVGEPAPSVPDVDALAQFIRKVDGAHQLGALMLAEHIAGWLASSPEAKP